MRRGKNFRNKNEKATENVQTKENYIQQKKDNDTRFIAGIQETNTYQDQNKCILSQLSQLRKYALTSDSSSSTEISLSGYHHDFS